MGVYSFAVQRTIMRSVRAKPPSHYRLEIQSFASVSESLGKAGCIKSPEFTAADQTWTMSVYLGTMKQGFLSMYLTNVNKKEAQVTIRFFIYDYLRKKYLIIQNSSVKEYGSAKITFGIAKALKLADFKKVKNGFVKNDRCSFGVEVLKHIPGDSPGSSLVNGIKKPHTHSWITTKYSSDLPDPIRSDPFTLLGRQWRIQIYPKGNPTAREKCLSMYLYLDDPSDLVYGKKLFAEYELCVVNNSDSKKSIKKTNTSWYEQNATTSSGIDDMIPLKKLEDTSEGYLTDKCLKLEVTIKNLFVCK